MGRKKMFLHLCPQLNSQLNSSFLLESNTKYRSVESVSEAVRLIKTL